MTYFIKESQLKTNLNKLGVKSFDADILDTVNALQQKVVHDLLSQQQKQQKGGRVSFPIDYFGGQTANLSTSTPDFTSMAPTSSVIRPEMPASQDFNGIIGGGARRYTVSDTAAKECAKKVIQESNVDLDARSKQQLVKASKQKFESVMTEVINKATSKAGTISKQKLQEVLKQKKYQQFKA